MDLYRTAKGEWHGTIADVTAANKAEGSPLGAWKKVKVPDKKASRIDFLNTLHRAAQEAEEREERSAPASPTSKPSKGARWRVYGGSSPVFVGVAIADHEQDAIDIISHTLTAVQTG